MRTHINRATSFESSVPLALQTEHCVWEMKADLRFTLSFDFELLPHNPVTALI